jgi:transposase-like protein
MLPFAGFVHAKIRCPKCHKDEVKFRAAIVIGAKHKCPHCHTTYRVKDVRAIGSPKSKKTLR